MARANNITGGITASNDVANSLFASGYDFGADLAVDNPLVDDTLNDGSIAFVSIGRNMTDTDIVAGVRPSWPIVDTTWGNGNEDDNAGAATGTIGWVRVLGVISAAGGNDHGIQAASGAFTVMAANGTVVAGPGIDYTLDNVGGRVGVQIV